MNQIIQEAVEEFASKFSVVMNSNGELATDLLTQKLTEVYMAGRSDAVEFIWENFTDNKYAEMWGEEDEEDDDEHSTSFRIFFSNLLEQAKQPPTCCDNCRLLESPPCRFCPCHSVKDNN